MFAFLYTCQRYLFSMKTYLALPCPLPLLLVRVSLFYACCQCFSMFIALMRAANAPPTSIFPLCFLLMFLLIFVYHLCLLSIILKCLLLYMHGANAFLMLISPLDSMLSFTHSSCLLLSHTPIYISQLFQI